MYITSNTPFCIHSVVSNANCLLFKARPCFGKIALLVLGTTL